MLSIRDSKLILLDSYSLSRAGRLASIACWSLISRRLKYYSISSKSTHSQLASWPWLARNLLVGFKLLLPEYCMLVIAYSAFSASWFCSSLVQARGGKNMKIAAQNSRVSAVFTRDEMIITPPRYIFEVHLIR